MEINKNSLFNIMQIRVFVSSSCLGGIASGKHHFSKNKKIDNNKTNFEKK